MLLISPSRRSKSLRRFLLGASLALLLASSLSCAPKVFDELGGITSLRDHLIKQFPEEQVNVELYNTALQITFINSPLNERPIKERIMRAQDTALLTKRHYQKIANLDRLTVSFIRSQTRMVVITDTHVVDSFAFNREAKPIGAPDDYQPSAFKGEADVHVIYNPARDESEVRIIRLQLSGDVNSGLMWSLHFKLPGDVSTAGRSKGIPAAVVFTFSSIAPEKVFKADQQLRIVADGHTIFNDKAHNQSVDTEGGNEFLVQGVPLPQFLQMTQAKTVILGLGDKEYLVSDRQLESLREMASYAEVSRK